MAVTKRPLPSQTSAQQFGEIAAAELDALRAFIAILEREREALLTRDEDALPALAGEKTDVAQTLSDCANRRVRLLEAAGVGPRTAEIRHLLDDQPDTLVAWDNVLAAAAHASELNMANGFILKQRLTQIDQALALLAGPHTPLYDTSGIRTRSLSASRSLGSV